MENKKDNEIVVLTKDEYDVMAGSYKNISSINNNIKVLLNNTVLNYLKIGFLLNCLTDDILNQLGCSNVYEYALENFGIGTTTTKNFINIYKRFGKQVELDDISQAVYKLYDVNIQNEYKDYSMTQLVELLTVSDEEITTYSPSLSVKEIRALKKISQLTDYEKKFIDHVKVSFEGIFDEVISKINVFDIFDEFKINIPDKVIFNDKKFTFNFNYRKHKNLCSIIISNTYDLFYFYIQSETIGYSFKSFTTASLKENSTDKDLDAVVDEIFNFITTTLIEFYVKYDMPTEEVDELGNVIDQIKEKFETMTFDLLLSKNFEDTLFKHATYNLKHDLEKLKEIYELYSDCPFFKNKFNYTLDRYNLDLSYKLSDYLTFYIKNGSGICFEFSIGDYSEYLEFEDLFKYPGVLKNYGLKCAATTSSFFGLYYDFAIGWWSTKQNELYLKQKEQEENDNVDFDPDNDDEEYDEDVDYE